MKQNNQEKINELQIKIVEADQRKNEALIELSGLKKLMIVVEDQIIAERLLIEKYQRELEFELYQIAFS